MTQRGGSASSRTSSLGARHEENYRNLCALQAGFRHLLERAMQRLCGKDWFTVVCPKHVFHRLIHRKEWELPIDHQANEYQELMSYTTFTDMADIVAGSGGVAKLFKRLASSEEEILRVLDHLERCRRHLAFGHNLSAADSQLLATARSGFDNFIERSKRRQDDGPNNTPPWDLLSEPVHETPSEENAAEAAPAPIAPEDSTEFTPVVAPLEDDAKAPPEPQAQDVQVETWGGAEALERGDDDGVLEALRSEVGALAENIYGEPNEHGPGLWVLLGTHGWTEQLEADPLLADLRRFYEIFDDFEARRRQGAQPEDLRARADEKALPALLLRLRDEFSEVAGRR